MIQYDDLDQPKIIENQNIIENTENLPTESAAPISCPLVLQCLDCRAIVGDTCSVLDLNPTLRTITLQKKGNNAVVDEDLHTSREEVDYGSTYHLIKCRNCSKALGRMYRTTSPELDLWRGSFTFSSDLLSFYELITEFPISNEHSTLLSSSNTLSLQNIENGNTTISTINQDNSISSSSSNTQMEITKIQKFCVYLFEKCKKLENEIKSLKDSISKTNDR